MPSTRLYIDPQARTVTTKAAASRRRLGTRLLRRGGAIAAAIDRSSSSPSRLSSGDRWLIVWPLFPEGVAGGH